MDWIFTSIQIRSEELSLSHHTSPRLPQREFEVEMSDPDMSSDFIVLINDEEQYSLWSGSIAVPAGWRVVHGPASKQACLDYVDEVWTDLTPRSVRLARQAPTVPADTQE